LGVLLPRIYNKKYSREELLKRVGTIHQVYYNRIFELIEGKEKGVRGIDIRNSSGLNFIVLFDRGMDIPYAEYKGIPLGWNSHIGYVAPSFYEPEKDEWLRGYFGGLLTTCGLTYMGAPDVDLGEELGLHGRISYTPAERYSVEEYWNGDEYFIQVSGVLREAKVFGPNIVLERKVRTRMGSKKIIIEDVVRNEGWEPQPLMILYHINIGFPILDEGSRLVSTTTKIVARDDEARKGQEEYDLFHGPVKGYKEKVYFHDLETDNEGYAYAAIINDDLYEGMGVYVKFNKKTLKRFVQWKMLGEGLYVVGIEPANSFVMGRSWERKMGTLEYIEPQKEKKFYVEIGVLEGREEISKFESTVKQIKKDTKAMFFESIEDFLKHAR